jgi:hypothetical protein
LAPASGITLSAAVTLIEASSPTNDPHRIDTRSFGTSTSFLAMMRGVSDNALKRFFAGSTFMIPADAFQKISAAAAAVWFYFSLRRHCVENGSNLRERRAGLVSKRRRDTLMIVWRIEIFRVGI